MLLFVIASVSEAINRVERSGTVDYFGYRLAMTGRQVAKNPQKKRAQTMAKP